VDLLAHLSGAFDVAEGQPVGHAVRVAHLAMTFASRLGLDAAARRRVLHAALLHDSGVAVRELPPGVNVSGGHTAAGAWIASLLGLDVEIQHAIRCTHERWDGEGRPQRLAMGDIPVASLLVIAAHWAVDAMAQAAHPLRARASLRAATLDDLEPLVGLTVGRAVIEELRSDAVWMSLWDDRLMALVCAQAPGEGRPLQQHVERVAAAMGEVVDASVREPGRSQHVAELAVELGRALGLEPAYLRALRVAGLLLDIGQLGVPRNITEKPAILTVDEMELMQRHPGWASRWLDGLPGFAEIAHWIEGHHERPDGRGYPEQLTAAEVPLASRILAVADTYWALCAERPYRPALSPTEAVAIIEEQAGQQFDAGVVAVLRQAVAALDQQAVRAA
jgi:HD-GYP domain-containing protein (c-di-GMP phosphodiesterase class II)